jgi:hypothetical protein
MRRKEKVMRRDVCGNCGRVVLYEPVTDAAGNVCAYLPKLHRPGRHAAATGTMQATARMGRDELREHRCDGKEIKRVAQNKG